MLTLFVTIHNYTPPHPAPLPAFAALLRALWQGDGNLLDLLPGSAYRFEAGTLGYSRRSTLLFNKPEWLEEILRDEGEVFPKSDLMVNALEPLIGDSIFVTDGERWRRQRRMIDPAFSQLRLSVAFAAMQESADAFLARLGELSASQESFSLDLEMSHLTADVICRTLFSVPLQGQTARDVFDDFTLFERNVAQVDIRRLITQPAWADMPQKPEVLAACQRIRRHLAQLLEAHFVPDAAFDDIASAMITAADSTTGERFSRDELIDQLGVFFLAGHETSASALTWVFILLSALPQWRARLRKEVYDVAGNDTISPEHLRRMPQLKAFFKETLRLYPPITFLPRVALKTTQIGGIPIKRGALVMLSPWTLHRHETYWRHPHQFAPERFLPDATTPLYPGAYIPFGQGPHTCIGAGFAQTEALLIMATTLRAFDLRALPDQTLRPAARLTTRPVNQFMMRAFTQS
jgi:cytochrome P450